MTAAENSAQQENIRDNKRVEKRVVRLASMLRIGTWVLMALLISFFILVVGIVLSVPTNEAGVSIFSIFTEMVAVPKLILEDVYKNGMTLNAKILFFALLTLATLWGLYSISRLHHLFGNFKQHKIFTKHNTKLIRNFGYAQIIGVIVTWVIFGSIFLVLSSLSTGLISAIPILKFSFDGSLIIKFMMISMVFLSAWILEIGCELYNDSEYTI